MNKNYKNKKKLSIQRSYLQFISHLKFSLLLLNIFLISIQSCTFKPAPPQIIKEANTKTALVHTVRENETIEEIASWYTGKEQNKKAILEFNKKNPTTKLKKGDKIIIPSDLVIRKDKLKKSSTQASKKSTSKKTIPTKKEKLEKIDPDSEIINPNPVDLEPEEKNEPQKNEALKNESQIEFEPLPPPEESASPIPNPSIEPENPKDTRRIELLKELLEK